jgi:hypothetical protein
VVGLWQGWSGTLFKEGLFAAFAGMLKWNWDIIPVGIGSGVLGLGYKLLMR